MPSLDTSSLQFGELFGVLTTFETDIKTNTIFNKHEEYIEKLKYVFKKQKFYVIIKRNRRKKYLHIYKFK